MKHFSFLELLRFKLWIASILLGLIGILAYVAALRYETISLVQPMLSISIITTVIVGWMLFKEKIAAKWLYILLIIIGVVLVSV